jgi:hypothetical protein
MGIGFSAGQAIHACGDVSNNLTATGTTNADALPISTVIARVTTAAAGTGVRLMTPEEGAQVAIINSGANPLLVYPSTGAAINALAVTTGGFSVPAGGRALFVATGSANWFAILSA